MEKTYLLISKSQYLYNKRKGYTYLLLDRDEENRKNGILTEEYIMDVNNDEFVNTHKVVQFDDVVFDALADTYAFGNGEDIHTISKRLPNQIIRDIIYQYEEMTLDYSFDNTYAFNHINEDYKSLRKVVHYERVD